MTGPSDAAANRRLNAAEPGNEDGGAVAGVSVSAGGMPQAGQAVAGTHDAGAHGSGPHDIVTHSAGVRGVGGEPPPAMFRRAVEVGLIAYAAFHLYTSIFGTLEPLNQRGIFIGGGLGFIFLGLAVNEWRRAPLA